MTDRIVQDKGGWVMKPMFSYFGSKYRLAAKYGAPRHDTVIEAFAGSAAYSLFWEPKNVLLVDKNPIIISIWDYLIGASEKDVLQLPLKFNHIDDLDCEEGAKNLIGFWIGKGKTTPAKSKSKWGRQYENSGDCKVWGEKVKERIVSQLPKIKHWKTLCADYTKIPNKAAHWFIDPPYQVVGTAYPFKDIDYSDLAEWVRVRRGFVQACENTGATYLPFKKFRTIHTYHHMTKDGKRKAKYTEEVLYEQGK